MSICGRDHGIDAGRCGTDLHGTSQGRRRGSGHSFDRQNRCPTGGSGGGDEATGQGRPSEQHCRSTRATGGACVPCDYRGLGRGEVVQEAQTGIGRFAHGGLGAAGCETATVCVEYGQEGGRDGGASRRARTAVQRDRGDTYRGDGPKGEVGVQRQDCDETPGGDDPDARLPDPAPGLYRRALQDVGHQGRLWGGGGRSGSGELPDQRDGQPRLDDEPHGRAAEDRCEQADSSRNKGVESHARD